MKVKIVAQFADENGNYSHAELAKGIYADVRDHIAVQWSHNGWAIILPEKEPEKATIIQQVESTGEIETPEDSLPEKETATIKRRGRRAAG